MARNILNTVPKEGLYGQIELAAGTGAASGLQPRHVSGETFYEALRRAKQMGSILVERRGTPEIMPETQGAPLAAEASSSDERAAAATAEYQGSETVLVVSDEPMLREMIAKILRQLGYCVWEAAGSEEARYLTRTLRDVRLLLADFSAPESKGLELARWFQRKYPGMKVLITTDSVWDLANQVGEKEQVAILLKPFDNLQLSRMVRLVLS